MCSKSWIDTSTLDMRSEGIKQIVNETNIALDVFNENHFACEEGGKFFIYTETKDEDGNFKLTRLSYKDFAFRYNCNDIYVPSGKNGNPFIKKGIGSYWMSCPQKRTYNGIIFNPKSTNSDFYNLWTGFKIDSSSDGAFPHIEKHLKEVWCNGDEEYYAYLIKWFAHLVQYPYEKPGVALVIKGEKGTGKTGFISKLADMILKEHYMLVSSSRDIYGHFNAQQYGKLLITFDEAIWNGDKGMEGRLKSLITDLNILVEKKGMDAEITKNYARYILLTNEKFTVPATYDERRFCALRISNKYKQDTEYFSELYDAMDQGEIASFFGFLSRHKFNKKDVFTPPATRALFEDVLENMDFFDNWLFNLIDDYAIKYKTSELIYDIGSVETISFGRFVRTKTLFENFRDAKERSGRYSSIFTQTKFTQKLTNKKDGSYNFQYGKHEGHNCIFLPTIEDAKRIFEKKYTCIVDWTEFNEKGNIPEYDTFIKLLKDNFKSRSCKKNAIKTAHSMYKDKQFTEEFGHMLGIDNSNVA